MDKIYKKFVCFFIFILYDKYIEVKTLNYIQILYVLKSYISHIMLKKL